MKKLDVINEQMERSTLDLGTVSCMLLVGDLLPEKTSYFKAPFSLKVPCLVIRREVERTFLAQGSSPIQPAKVLVNVK